MQTLWITGTGGIVGSRLVDEAVRQGKYDRICAFAHALTSLPANSVDGVQWATLDIGDREAVQDAARLAPPNVIINPAAMTDVDACERERDAARRANADGPRFLAEIARERGARLIHVSTDYVFPGNETHPGPYHEDAVPSPIN